MTRAEHIRGLNARMRGAYEVFFWAVSVHHQGEIKQSKLNFMSFPPYIIFNSDSYTEEIEFLWNSIESF